MAGSPLDTALLAGGRIGRYFSIVALLPGTVLVFYLAGLAACGAVAGPFELSGLNSALAGLGFAELSWLLAASMIVGLCLQPLTYGFTQLLEGYWGASPLGLRLAEHQVQRHRRRLFRLRALEKAARDDWRGSLPSVANPTPASLREQRSIADQRARSTMAYERGDDKVGPYLRMEAARIAQLAYPDQTYRIMPTRLGNSLRQMEDSAGKQYGLDAITVFPRLSIAGDPRANDFVAKERETLDLMVNLCVVGVMGCAATLLLLSDDGFWVTVALAPFTFAWAAYHGAVGSSSDFTAAVTTMIDLSRFHLYASLHMDQPRTLAEERMLGEKVTRMLRGDRRQDGRLDHGDVIERSQPPSRRFSPSRSR